MKTVTFNSTTLQPSKIVCIGRNYVEHIAELNNEVPEQPVVFLKPNSAIGETLIAYNNGEIHYEGEICFVVNKQKLAGIGVGLDLTKRDAQSELKAKGLPWERAKAFDCSALFSQFIEIQGDLSDYRMELLINNQTIQVANYDLMMAKPQSLLEEVQSFMSFEDGDILMTGTPKGVGKVNQGDEFTIKLFLQEKLVIEQSWQAN